MKFTFIALFLFCSVGLSGQTIERVYVVSNYDPKYVLSLAYEIVPEGSNYSIAAIECLRSELAATGMFDGMKVRRIAHGPGKIHLYLYPKYKSNPNRYRLARVFLDDSLEAIRVDLQRRLDSRGLRAGRPFMPYSGIERDVAGIRSDLENESENTPMPEFWIRAVLRKNNKVELRITKMTPFCPSRLRESQPPGLVGWNQ
jgi:hypothetical protein